MTITQALFRAQRGIAAVLTALSIFALMGFAALVIDLGRLYVIKTELQTAVDSCALAAAGYLRYATPGQLTLAEAVGKNLGSRHSAIFQKDSLVFGAANITFSETLQDGYSQASAVADPQKIAYVRCEMSRTSIAHSFMRVLGVSEGAVSATATASLTPSIRVCILPLAMCSEEKPFVAGNWYRGNASSTCAKNDQNCVEQVSGAFRWVRLPDDSGSVDIVRRLESSGACDVVSVDEGVQSENGKMANIAAALNTRFGIYASKYGAQPSQITADDPPPDRVGHSYTQMTWIDTGNLEAAAYSDYAAKWAATTSSNVYDYQDQTKSQLRDGENTGTEMDQNDLVLTDGNLYSRRDDTRRRLLMMPVTQCTGGGLDVATGSNTTPVTEWACVFLLHPMGTDGVLDIAYVDDASTLSSPCGSGGAPGPGGTGPLVRGLVQ